MTFRDTTRTPAAASARLLLRTRWLTAAGVMACLPLLPFVHAHADDASPMASAAKPLPVYRSAVWPHWLADERLWYTVDTGPDAKEWVLVEADGRTRRFAARDQLQAALGPAVNLDAAMHPRAQPEVAPQTGRPVELRIRNRTAGPVQLWWRKPHDQEVAYGTVPAGAEIRRPTYAGHVWRLGDANGGVFGYVTAPEADAVVDVDGAAAPASPDGATSPDGRWFAFTRGDDVWVRPATGQGAEVRLSQDGAAGDSYRSTGYFWSPDSTKLVAFRVKAAPEHRLELVSKALDPAGRPRAVSVNYLRPGDAIDHPRPVLFDLARHTAVTLADRLFPQPYGLLALGAERFDNGVTWAADSSRFFFAYNERGHRLMRVIAVDAASAAPSALFEDRSDTFIDYSSKYWARYLATSDEIVWASERDGWNHLYVHDARTGLLKRRLTGGEWLVRQVESVDERAGSLVARVVGRNLGQDPYHEHFVRIDLADGKLTPLTEADATHELAFSPDASRYIDSYSRIDLPPAHELRRASDGKLLATLERADADARRRAGGQPPERFVAKGRDGKTDIWGIVVRPPNFDPTRRYPVIENIYGGPQGAFVPKRWGGVTPDVMALAAQGFIVVRIDGMGTNWRSKAFHDVTYKNLKDAGFSDRISWIRALAQAHMGSLDLDRVGIYGTSAGGQNAASALVWHHDFYKVAVADSGCHDNRLDKLWWNEQWMGYPVDRSYADSSNIENAALMQGALLVADGDLDSNVDPVASRQLYAALKKAGKDVEQAEFAGKGHGTVEGGEGLARMLAFFNERLMAPQATSAQ